MLYICYVKYTLAAIQEKPLLKKNCIFADTKI